MENEVQSLTLTNMKRIKLLIAAIAVSVFGINASAQYWGESEVTNYVYAGFTSLKVGETLPGFHIGLGDLNQMNRGNIFWDYNIELAYNAKSENGAKDKTLNFKYAMDLLYKFDASENTFIFPFVGIACRPFITGKSSVDGFGDVNWFKSDEGNGNRFQAGLQAGVHAFIGKIMLRAEYQYYLTKVFKGGDNTSAIALSIGYRF